MHMHLASRRLVLRRFTKTDVDLLEALDGDPEVMRFLSATPTPRDAIEQQILPHWIAEYTRSPGFGCWAAMHRETGDFVGWFSLRDDGHPGDAELGYRLRRAAWGKGLATEGGRALIDRAFGEMGVERIWAQTMAINGGSRRVMEKLGMRYIRTFHMDFDNPLPGTEKGEVEYAITRAAWLAHPTFA